jgi:hypothetical protein
MPKTEIDYSNTIIYKIVCKDTNVSDLYVGHTINFVQRKRAHKQSCISNKSPNYNCKVYEVIRNNGGWNNWKMDIIHFFNCKDQFEARQKEQEYFVSLNATLNSIEPMPESKTKPVEVLENKVKNTEDLNKQFGCEKCNYYTNNKKDYDKHLLTLKHTKEENEIIQEDKTSYNYNCDCGKEYKHRQGLWKHKKTHNCNVNAELSNDDNNVNDNTLLTNLVIEVVKNNNSLQKQCLELQKQNQDFQQKMIESFNEVIKNCTPYSNTINNINSHS